MVISGSQKYGPFFSPSADLCCCLKRGSHKGLLLTIDAVSQSELGNPFLGVHV